MCDASATMINLGQLFLGPCPPPTCILASPASPPNWQQHKSQGCIKNTLGKRKKLRLGLSDREYLLGNELSTDILMHHHCHFDNVVTYGLTKCTPKHFLIVWAIWIYWIYEISKDPCAVFPVPAKNSQRQCARKNRRSGCGGGGPSGKTTFTFHCTLKKNQKR